MKRRILRSVFVALGAAALTHAAAGASAEPPVSLPPFLVEGKSRMPPWRYAQSPEFEILSRVPDSTTQQLVASFHRLHQLLGVILPENFQVRFDVPKSLILYDQTLLPTTAQAMLDGGSTSHPTPVTGKSYGTLRNPRLSDVDVMTVFASVPPSELATSTRARFSLEPPSVGEPGYQPGWTSLTPDYVEELITKRTPPLPVWFVSGFAGLYRKMHFSADTIEVGAVFWLSDGETRALRKNPQEFPTLLPLESLFAGPGTDAKKFDLWFAQTELFVRWALEDEKGYWRERFWQFLDRSGQEPASEALFKECFGIGYDHGAALLKRYLLSAVLKPAAWHAKGSSELPALELRDATAAELARIKGDWERLAASYVRNHSPSLETPYLDQARHTLQRAYDKGDRDPRLLAALGLCECDAGNDAGAREYLEAAVSGRVVRPRAYFELARIRFAEERARQESPQAKLNAAQTADLLALLAVARTQAPPLRSVYELGAEIWIQSAMTPQRGDFAFLAEGTRLFPRDAGLMLRAATLYAAHGFSNEAGISIEHGLKIAPNAALRESFLQLRDSMTTAGR
jgi:hypothetical protein